MIATVFWTNLGSPSLFVSDKLVSVLAVWQRIRLHPLSGVLSSLRSNAIHFGKRAKIYLKPLMSISPLCAPGPSVSTVSAPVQSSAPRSAPVVIVRGSTHHFIVDAFVFETKWHVAAIWDKEKNNCQVKSISHPVVLESPVLWIFFGDFNKTKTFDSRNQNDWWLWKSLDFIVYFSYEP